MYYPHSIPQEQVARAAVAAPLNEKKLTARQLAFLMRKLWSDHVLWTRFYMLAVLGKRERIEIDLTLTRLLKNQDELGHAFAMFYGAAWGRELTRLLKDHIVIAGKIIGAGVITPPRDLETKWIENADAIALFLSNINKRWSLPIMREMWREHLKLTTAELVEHLRGAYAAEIIAFDAVLVQALKMADVFSLALAQQYRIG